MGDTGLLGPERPAPSPVLSLKLELLVFCGGCCLFSVWGLLAGLAATGTARPGSARPCVGPRPRVDLLGVSVELLPQDWPAEASVSWGHGEGLAPPRVGHACRGHVPWPWVRALVRLCRESRRANRM